MKTTGCSKVSLSTSETQLVKCQILTNANQSQRNTGIRKVLKAGTMTNCQTPLRPTSTQRSYSSGQIMSLLSVEAAIFYF